MKKLLELISNEYCDSDGWFRILSAKWIADKLRLEVSLNLSDEKEEELWEITCEFVFEEKIISECADLLDIKADHPILLKFKEAEVDLAFTDNNMCQDELFGIIVNSIVKHLGEQPISNWINQKPLSEGICSSKYGILGVFPEIVANEICRLVKGKEIAINKLEPRSPKYWDGIQHCEYPSNIEVLLIGDSYVVGAGFSAKRA